MKKEDALTPFHVVRDAVAAQFARMLASNEPLFQTDAPGDELWATYLSSFPDGADPVHKTRTEHDCQSCRQFIRALGGAVTVAGTSPSPRCGTSPKPWISAATAPW